MNLVADIILWGLVAGLAGLALMRNRALLRAALVAGVKDFVALMPRIALGVIGAGFIAAAIPASVITGMLGPESGWSGILLASLAGAITPSGPVVGFALAASALKAGAGSAQVVAYIVGWAVLGLQRVLVFELPVMPARFIWLRLAASLPIPLLAGAAAMMLGRP